MAASWKRIPANITSEDDRRALSALLVAYGLEVRIARVKETNRGTPKRFIEYRDTGMIEPKLITTVDVKS